jgi:hypothetical protein
MPVRRESSTVVALVGQVSGGLLAALAESPNVAVLSIRAADRAAHPAEQGAPAGWEAGAEAMRVAARRRATYVVVPADPLAGVAAAWRAMWDLAAGPDAAMGFEEAAADALSAWRAKQFELPDYYLVIAPPEDAATGPDLYLGPVRAARPHRVAVGATAAPDDAASSGGRASAFSLLDTLRSLPHGPWWPPLEDLLDGARRFYAGGLAETQQAST